MKNSGGSGNQAALCLPHEAFGIPDGKEIFPVSMPEQIAFFRETKNTTSGISEDARFQQLILENQRLKELVEGLMLDKFSQAQRIMELNEEKSRLKKALADLILDKRD